LTRRYARHTVEAAVAVALGGRPGSRLAQRLAVAVSRTTLIRMIRRMPDPPPVTPTVLDVTPEPASPSPCATRRQSIGLGVLFITHELGDAVQSCGQILVLHP